MSKMRRIKAKLAFILFALSMVFVALGGRVLYLKSVYGSEYETAARNQQVSKYDEIISPNRGSIVDRNNQALAISTTVYNIVLDVRVLVQYDMDIQEKTLNALATNLNLDYNTLKGYTVLDENGTPALDTSWKVLAKEQTKEVKEKLEAEGVKGVVFQKDTKRKYPTGVMASQVIGFVRDAMWGLEKQYNEEMSGVPGRSFITYNGTDGTLAQEIPAQDGNTIVTTLDYQIQQYAQQAADEIMEAYNAEYTASIVMDPNTAEVIAMAQTPTFDLNNPTDPLYIDDAAWEAMDEESQYEYLNKSWRNFCVSDTFEPGSIFKPVVVAAAIEQGLLKPSDTFYCGGVKHVGGWDIPCNLRSGHGNVTVQDVIAYSCNVGMMDIAEKMGPSIFYDAQLDFGVGSLTGIDLPAEAGNSPYLMYAEEDIHDSELATMSFGQSFSTTAIQAATYMCSLINGGNIMKPYIVSQIVDTDGNIVSETKPEVVRKVISKETSDIMRNMMVATVDYGTGKKAKIEGYTFGAKTGTAQQGVRANNEYALTYAAFLPVENPQYFVLTLAYKPESYADGVTTVAPMTKTLIENIIKYKNIEPDNLSEASEAAATDQTATVTLPDYTGSFLQAVLYDIDNNNLKYEIVGSGNTVVNQAPHGGTVVNEGTSIIIYVEKGEGETGSIVVPDVSGMSYTDAVDKITNAGLSAVIEGDEDGTAVKTDPAYGITVDEGAEITIYFEKVEEEETSDTTETPEGTENPS